MDMLSMVFLVILGGCLNIRLEQARGFTHERRFFSMSAVRSG
jgi:hypothetical protein